MRRQYVNAPQFDLPGTEQAFNLMGEIVREEAPQTQAPEPPRDVQTLPMFPDLEGRP